MRWLLMISLVIFPFVLWAQDIADESIDSYEDEVNQEVPIFGIRYEVYPEFPSGETALRQFLGQVKYPQSMIGIGCEGKVYVSFSIDTLGDHGDYKVLRQPDGCEALGKAAIEQLKLMSRWKPGTLRGIPTPMAMAVPFQFTLSEEQKQQASKVMMLHGKPGN